MNPLLRFKQQDGTTFPDWEALTLGDVGHVCSCGRVYKRDTQPTGEVPFFKISTFGGEPDAYITTELLHELKAKHSYPTTGAVLFSTTATIGKSVVYKGEAAYFKSPHIVWLEHDHTIDDAFLKHFYTVAKWQGVTGSVTKFLTRHGIRDTPFHRPCLNEQRKIATCLNAMDEVIQKAEHALHALQAQNQTISAALLHGALRFSPRAKWQPTEMRELFTLSVGRDIKPESYSPTKSEAYPYPIYANTSDKDVTYGYANYFQHEGDTITVTARGTVGHAIARHNKYVATGRLLVCTPKAKNQDCMEFFAHLFNHTTLNTGSTAVPQLTAPELSSLKLQRPPLSEQERIATAINAMADVIAHEEAELKAWQALKQGLLQQLFP